MPKYSYSSPGSFCSLKSLFQTWCHTLTPAGDAPEWLLLILESAVLGCEWPSGWAYRLQSTATTHLQFTECLDTMPCSVLAKPRLQLGISLDCSIPSCRLNLPDCLQTLVLLSPSAQDAVYRSHNWRLVCSFLSSFALRPQQCQCPVMMA